MVVIQNIMNVVKENTNEQTISIRARVEQADYVEKVEKKLKDYRKNSNIKGFRPGMAPAALIHRMYYKYVLVDEVTHIAFDAVMDYIDKEKIKILGEPLPSEGQNTINWDTDKEFELAWEIGVAPEFEIKLGKKDKIPFYNIAPDDKIRKQYIDSYLMRFGHFAEADETNERGLIEATLTELNSDETPREGGLFVERATISVELVADPDERAKLVGVKVGDVLTIDVQKAFPNEADRASLLSTQKENLPNIQPVFQLTVNKTSNYQPAELNQELFDRVFGEGVVTTEEEFYQKIDEEIESGLKNEGENRFAVELRNILLNKIDMQLPKDFLIRWLTTINEGKFTRDQVENEYPLFEGDLKWQLIRNKIASEQNFTVTNDEMESFAMEYAQQQFMAYGMSYLPKEYIERYAKDILKNQDEIRKMQEGIISRKVIAWFKENLPLDVKEITHEEFDKLEPVSGK